MTTPSVDLGLGWSAELEVVAGKVVGEKRWSETEARGRGGGGAIVSGNGFVSGTRIDSKITTRDQVFVQTDDGGEIVLDLQNADIAVRPGHRVIAIWGRRVGENRGPYLGLYNCATDHWTELDAGDLILSRLHLKYRLIAGLLIGFLP